MKIAAAKARVAATQNASEQGMLDRALCLAVEFGRLGNRRKVSASQVEVDADREFIRVSKALLDAPELREIERFDTTIRRYLYANCLPSCFKEGIFLVPVAMMEKVETRLAELRAEREKLVERFLEVYPRLVEETATRLRGLYDPKDYPSPSRVRQSFRFDWSYMAFDTPARLRGINRAIFDREREKLERAWAEATREVQAVLRASMAELVEHLVERLTGERDGKPKTFRDSLVGNLREFIDGFNLRNITDDEQLSAVVNKARALLSGIDPDTLRDNAMVRERVRKGFADIKTRIDKMMVDKQDAPKRAISFDEE